MDDGLERLQQAEQHVVEGQHRVAAQKERITELERDGHDTTSAQRLLVLFEESLLLMIAYRNRVRREPI